MACLVAVLRSKFGATLLAVLLCAAVAGWEGYQSGSERVQRLWDAEKARTSAGIIKSVEVQDARNNVAAARYEVKREHRERAYRQINRNVDRLPVADCGLSDDGLREWNNANSGGDTEAASSTDGAMPGEPAESAERGSDDAAAESH